MAEPDRTNFRRSVKEWRQQIELGIKYKEDFGFSKIWPQLKEYYRNKFKDGVFPVNEIFSHARSSVPRVYYRNPRVVVTAPNRPDLAAHAKVVEAADNELVRETGLKRELKRGALDAFMCNHAFFKIGYDHEFGFDPTKVSKRFKDTSLNMFDDKGNRLSYNLHAQPGLPWALRTNPDMIVVPWGADRMYNSRWVAFRFIRPLDDIKADKLYEKANTKDLRATHLPRRDHRDFLAILMENGEYVAGWEIHDVRTGSVSVIVDDSDVFLRDHEPDALQVEGLPCVEMLYNDDIDFFWGVPDAEIARPQQLWINEVNTLILKHVRLSILKIIVDKNKFPDDTELDKLVSEEVKAIVRAKGPVGDESVRNFQHTMPLDVKVIKDMVREDLRETLGFSANQLGQFNQSSRRTASEALIVQQASDLRSNERRDIMSDALTEIVRKYNQLIFKFWTEEKVSQVVGLDKVRYWVKYTGPEIRGEYSLQVDPDDANPLTKLIRRKELTEIVGLMKNTGLPIETMMRQLLMEYPGIDLDQIMPQPVGTTDRPLGMTDFVDRQRAFQAKSAAQSNGGLNRLTERVAAS